MQTYTLNQTGAIVLDQTASELTDPICEFYTDHPYPPPVENLDRARDEWQDASRHRAEYHLFWPHKKYRADLDILVAGCGTWQAAKYALCRPDAQVVGVDVSTTSLDHTERLKRKYGLTNLRLEQIPIERVAGLQQRFDLIICTGVLHHLSDPDAGLRALRSALKPDDGRRSVAEITNGDRSTRSSFSRTSGATTRWSSTHRNHESQRTTREEGPMTL